jgi:hypothetical protein
VFRMGGDVFFDCDLNAAGRTGTDSNIVTRVI